MTGTHVKLSLFVLGGAVSTLRGDKLILLRYGYHTIFTSKLFPGYVPHRLCVEGPLLVYAIIKNKSHRRIMRCYAIKSWTNTIYGLLQKRKGRLTNLAQN